MLEQNHILDNVLVVDDDPILRAIAERHFQERGSHNVASAGDGVQALGLLDNARDEPGFLLCDLNMPNMDGIEFLRHLERRKFTGAIAILSGEDESVVALAESLADAHKLNVVGKLQKPLKADDLDDLIEIAKAQYAAPAQVTGTVINIQDIKRAIAADQIVAYHQPKIETRTGRFVGTEALARWLHPDWGMVPPDRFISLVEQSGFIEQLTDVVVDAALSDVQHWTAHGLPASCSINLSAKVLTNIDFPDEIAAKVDAAGLERRQIILEITESCLLEKQAVPMEILARLRLKGFDLSVDDFGTGHSNIEMLRNFPFNELKIDHSFVSVMQEDAFAAESVSSCVDLAKRLGLRIVAEGVETQAVCDLIKEMEIDQIQGYLFAKPMTFENLKLWLKGHRMP